MLVLSKIRIITGGKEGSRRWEKIAQWVQSWMEVRHSDVLFYTVE